jgi:hypothetical protein
MGLRTSFQNNDIITQSRCALSHTPTVSSTGFMEGGEIEDMPIVGDNVVQDEVMLVPHTDECESMDEGGQSSHYRCHVLLLQVPSITPFLPIQQQPTKGALVTLLYQSFKLGTLAGPGEALQGLILRCE